MSIAASDLSIGGPQEEEVRRKSRKLNWYQGVEGWARCNTTFCRLPWSPPALLPHLSRQADEDRSGHFAERELPQPA